MNRGRGKSNEEAIEIEDSVLCKTTKTIKNHVVQLSEEFSQSLSKYKANKMQRARQSKQQSKIENKMLKYDISKQIEL